MAKLSDANLPDWLAQWAMNRGAIEDPSSSSGLFDQPVIRRRRPAERMDDESDDSWMDSGRSNQYVSSPTSPTASFPQQVMLDPTDRLFTLAGVRGQPYDYSQFGYDGKNNERDIEGWNKYYNDKASEENSLIDGASSMYNDAGRSIEKSTEQKKETGLLGTIKNAPENALRGLLGDTTVNFLNRVGNQGSFGSFKTAADDKTLPMSARVAGSLGAGMSLLMPGMGATGIGLFGGIANAMGFHHDFDSRYESNLSYNPESGRISWDSASLPGGGGHQYGDLNNQNFFEANPDQYFNVDGMGYMTGRDLATGTIPWGQFDQEIVSNFDDYTTDFNTNTPFGFQDFGQGDHNVTNQQALGQYNFDGTGAIQNEAGAIAEKLDVGYNQQQVIADMIADRVEVGYDDISSSDTGVDSVFGSTDDWSGWS